MRKDKTAVAINLFKAAVLLAIVSSILCSHNTPFTKFAMAAGITLCGMNDFLRIRFWQGKIKWVFNLSIMTSMAGAGLYYHLFHNLPSGIYFIFPLAETFAHSDDPLWLVMFHFAVYLAATFNFPKSYSWTGFLPYTAAVLILFLFRNISTERKKAQCLNDELKDANAKLKEYSEKIQKIAVVEERTKIAQELHDSIGHGLVALGMNLEFAENMIGADSGKAEAAVRRAHEQSQKCMADLRKAVAALKDGTLDQPASLKISLNKLFCQFQPERVKFNLSLYPCVEMESTLVRDCLYKLVREATTNGIRHGKASLFTICISKEANMIAVSVKDNGAGCANFVKSDGLIGIEKRVASLGGNVNFITKPNDGFCISAAIPSATLERKTDYD